MPDIVDAETRSRMMSGIRSKNTKPELLIRKGLHARGFRYRLHATTVQGKPDLVLPKWKAVIFINGCFWHGHNCHLFKMPSTRTEFWEAKINQNRDRDIKSSAAVRESGWRVLTIWECAVKGRTRLEFGELIDRVSAWITGYQKEAVIEGRK